MYLCNLYFKNEIFALKNIVFNAYPGDLICIIGSVGSGKVSSLFCTDEFKFS